MATRTTTQAGNASSSATWGGSTPPGPGDVAVVGHAVTVDTDRTIGHSPGNADATKALTVNSAGSLTIAAGVTLTVRGDAILDNATLTLAAGAKYRFDSTAAAGPSATHYTLQVGSASFQGAKVVANGTSAAHCSIESVSGGGNGRILSGVNVGGGLIQGTYLDFLRVGGGTDASDAAITFWPYTGQEWFLDHATFTACGMLTTDSHVYAGATWRLFDVRFSGSLGTDCMLIFASPTPTGGATRTFDRCYFDRRCQLYPPSGLVVTNTYFGNAFITGSGTPRWTLEDCFVRITETEGPQFIADSTNCFFLVDHTSGNAHFILVGTHQSTTHDGDIFEYGGAIPSGDCFMLGGGVAPTYTTIRRPLILPNSSGSDSGTLLSALGSDNNRVDIEHATCFCGEQGATIGESESGYAGKLASFRANLMWDDPPGGTPRGRKLLASTVVDDYVAAADCDYNAGWNLLPGDYTAIGYVDLPFSSGEPGVHDLDGEDPMFVDPGRDIRAWGVTRGADGTLAGALAVLAADPSLVPTCTAWIKAGFRPRNPAYANASYPGDPATLDAAGNALGGTIGAMAYTAGVPDLDLTGWDAIFDFPIGTYPAQIWDPQAFDHYDVLRCFENARAYVAREGGDTAPWDTVIASALAKNREGYALPNGGTANPVFNWNRGLMLHHFRTGAPLDRLAAVQARRFGGWSSDDKPAYHFIALNWADNRPAAFALLAHLGGEDAGHPPTARVHFLAAFQAQCLDQWLATDRSYFLFVMSFMAGLGMEALIAYWDRHRDDPSCPPDIPLKIKAMIDWLWANEWDEDSQSFLYADIMVPDLAILTGTVSGTSGGTQNIGGFDWVTFDGVSGMNAQDNYYTYGFVWFTSGALSGTWGLVLSYTGATRRFVITVLGTFPAPGDTFEVRQYAPGGGPTAAGPGPSYDTSLLVAPAYAWYARHTGDDTYREKFDLAFAGSSGGLGAIAQQKVWNETMRWGPQGLLWREQCVSPWPAETTLAFTAPDGATGRANAWSGRLVVEPAGTDTSVAGAVTVTLSDGGAGGDVRGNPIVTTDHRRIVLNYRPPSGSDGDTITLSVTNDGGLTDPAPIAYTVAGEAPVATGYSFTGPAAGPLDAESAPFTLALVPANGVLPADYDPVGGVANFATGDSLTAPITGYGTAAFRIIGATTRYADRIGLIDEIPSWQFTYRAATATGTPITGPYPGTTTLSEPPHSADPAVWSARPGLTYTAPDPSPPAFGPRRRRIAAAGS